MFNKGNILKLLPRILQFPESLGKNLGKILTKSAKNMYDLARSCQELQEKCLIFSTVKKSKKIQEMPRSLPRNPGKTKENALTFIYIQ